MQACSNGRYDTDDENDATQPADTAATRSEVPPAASESDAEVIALGRRIFRGGEAGGTCFACHGQDAKGTPTGPDLTDNEWLNTDGSKLEITAVIRTGVAEPKSFEAPMPPMGGAKLTDEQVTALVEYVYSLSHPQGVE
jgi:mono/diheme cytochrome c family protein